MPAACGGCAQKRPRSREEGPGVKQWTKGQLKALEDALLDFGEADAAPLRSAVCATRLHSSCACAR